MTTENGMEDLRYARRYIELLRDRLAFLDRWAAERDAVTGVKDTGVRYQEARAIRWALPVLEAEWDHLWRIHKLYIEPAEQAVVHEERKAKAEERRAACRT